MSHTLLLTPMHKCLTVYEVGENTVDDECACCKKKTICMLPVFLSCTCHILHVTSRKLRKKNEGYWWFW